MQIIDYVIIGIAVLFLIIGLIRGLVKMTFGLLAGLASLVAAIMLCTTVAGAVVSGTNWDESLANTYAKTIDVGTTTRLVYDRQPSGDVLGFYAENADGSTEFKKFGALFEGNIFMQMLSGPIESGIRGSYTPEVAAQGAQTASSLIASYASVVTFQAICFVVLWIAFAVILKIISILLKKFVSATFVGHFLDRVFGGVMGVAIACAIVMVCFTVIGLMHSMAFMEPVMAHIEASTVGKFLYDNNFIYNLLSANINFSILGGGTAAVQNALLLL